MNFFKNKTSASAVITAILSITPGVLAIFKVISLEQATELSVLLASVGISTTQYFHREATSVVRQEVKDVKDQVAEMSTEE